MLLPNKDKDFLCSSQLKKFMFSFVKCDFEEIPIDLIMPYDCYKVTLCFCQQSK